MAAQNVFAIFGASQPGDLDSLVESTFSDEARKIISGQWLVRTEANQAFEVYNKLFETHEPVRCIIVPAEGYYGFHDKAVWGWIEAAKNG